jgi:tripartite-type tricarboxylate transporter receptor subunit TctC
VPYKGGILAVTDLVAGQIDMVPAVPQIKAGKLRPLAVTPLQRSPALPDVPTLAEAGVREMVPDTWWAIMAPRGTPAAAINRINAALAQIMKQPDIQERYANLGIFRVHTTPERVMELVRIESPLIGKVLKAAGVEPE